MKILHINRNYMETALHQYFTKKLIEKKVVCNVFAPTHKGTSNSISPEPYVCVSECFRKSDRFFFYYKQYKIQKNLLAQYKISNYDLIHAYTLFTDGNTAMKISEIYNIPYIVAVRSTDILFFRKRIALRKLGEQILLKAKVVIFLSKVAMNEVIEEYVSEKNREIIIRKSRLIHNGIDDFWLENKPNVTNKMVEKEITVISVARIVKQKNILSLLKAIDILNAHGWKAKVKVIGRPDDKKELERIQKNINTMYLGTMPKELLIKEYRSSDIFVLPSYHETFGLVYAEAMSQGLPVIYSQNEGFDKLFPEGIVGYHVKPDSPNDIANKIELICKRYDEIQKTCLMKSEIFRWDRICDEYIAIYEGVLNAKYSHEK